MPQSAGTAPRLCATVDAEFRVGRDGGRRVAGHFDLRHDGDVALRRVPHDASHRILRIKAAVEARLARRGVEVALCRAAGRDTPGADFGKARVAVDLEPPGLVVGQVPVQHVEFVQRHPLDQSLDEFRATGNGVRNRASARASANAGHHRYARRESTRPDRTLSESPGPTARVAASCQSVTAPLRNPATSCAVSTTDIGVTSRR